MRLGHLALAVADQARSARFYGSHFGLRELRREADGVLMLGDESGFTLALGQSDGELATSPMPTFVHFGFPVADAATVRAKRAELAGAQAQEVDFVEEAGYVSVKVTDPDGYVVEVFWEPA